MTNTISFLEKTKLYIDINKLSTPSTTGATTISNSTTAGSGVAVERGSTPPVVGGSEYMAVG